MKPIKVVALPSFTKWLSNFRDETIKAIIAARIDPLKHGLMGDVEPLGDGVSELRIHYGSGWRVYFAYEQGNIVILLAGGAKNTQKQDIKIAKKLAGNL